MKNNEIKIGDLVNVNFHNSKYTLCRKAKVLHIPYATGDSWIFKDMDDDYIHYVSEGCTITKLKHRDSNE